MGDLPVRSCVELVPCVDLSLTPLDSRVLSTPELMSCCIKHMLALLPWHCTWSCGVRCLIFAPFYCCDLVNYVGFCWFWNQKFLNSSNPVRYVLAQCLGCIVKIGSVFLVPNMFASGCVAIS
uniref:Uncharacterized protein n=1 Tax=Physcomitrium patens TaxID=3218 RepID=A0A7I3ZHC5_PHYPA